MKWFGCLLRLRSLALALPVMACTTGPDLAAMDRLSPLALRDAFTAEHPTATAVSLLDFYGDGFVIGLDGRAEYRPFRAMSNLRAQTTVASIDDSEICLAPSDWWVGGCIELFGSAGEVSAARLEHATGAEVSWATTPEPVQ